MLVDAGPELDLLDLDGALLLARLVLFLLILVFELAVIEKLADRRVAVGRYRDQIQAFFGGLRNGFGGGENSEDRTVSIDDPDGLGANRLIDAAIVAGRRFEE